MRTCTHLGRTPRRHRRPSLSEEPAMPHPLPSAFLNRRGCAIAITLIAAIVSATPSRAGLGSLVKKAKEKAAQAAGQQAAPKPSADAGKVEFDSVVLELTNDRIEHILGAFKAASAAARGRPALLEKLN